MAIVIGSLLSINCVNACGDFWFGVLHRDGFKGDFVDY
ncbi:hypothetical protein [uncultured Gammaproteobacteria bacterium]|nr:hypothetical protein [uncultured Gammaproteobacteria bacterium]